MKTFKLLGLFVAGFIVGGIAVGLWAGHMFSQLTVSKEVEVAFQAAQEAEWLAELRLGETTGAIQSMESAMDSGVTAISEWESYNAPNEKTRKARDAFLTSVKVYHQSWPVVGDGATVITSLLATVPGRNPKSTCKAGVCRLDDLRLDKLKKSTNAR